VPSLLSSGEINVSTVVVTVVDNVTIVPAAESTADAEVETVPFNFSTSRRTCICRVQLTTSSPEYPLNLQSPGWIGVSLAHHE